MSDGMSWIRNNSADYTLYHFVEVLVDLDIIDKQLSWHLDTAWYYCEKF